MRAPTVLVALIVLLLGALQCVRAENNDDIYLALDAIDSGWGLGFRARYGDPQTTCNCSFTSQGSGVIFPCQWTRVGRNNAVEGFFCGSAANANPQIDSLIFETPVPAAPGAIIPTYIGLITSLRQLSLRGTGLGGSIPTEINMLSNLQTLYISGNALSLGIPDLSNLVSLTKLGLSTNGLVGNIPDSISLLTGLREIYLDNNRFEGPIDFVQLLRYLTVIRFENNQFSGTIPNALGLLPRIDELYLSNNLFTGDVPPAFLTLATTHCDIQLNDLNNCWDPVGLKASSAPMCQFNCRPCRDDGKYGPPDCSCSSPQPNPAHCLAGTWLFPTDLTVNGSNPLNIAYDKVAVSGAITQSSSGPIRVSVSTAAPATGNTISASGCVALGGPLYVDMHDVTGAVDLNVVQSGGGCLSGNFSRIVVTDKSGPACPRKNVKLSMTSSLATLAVPAASSCTGPAQSNDGPRITKPILIGIVLGTIAVALAIVGVVALVAFMKRTSATYSRV